MLRLGELLVGRPTALEDVIAILRLHLDGPVSPDTWTELSTSFRTYFGPVASRGLLWVLQAPEDRLEVAHAVASDRVSYLLDRVVALFARQLQAAYAALAEFPDDWRRIRRRITELREENRLSVRLDITKYSGDVVRLECTPNSLLQLCDLLVTYLKLIGPRANFPPDRVRELQAQVRDFASSVEDSDGPPVEVPEGQE